MERTGPFFFFADREILLISGRRMGRLFRKRLPELWKVLPDFWKFPETELIFLAWHGLFMVDMDGGRDLAAEQFLERTGLRTLPGFFQNCQFLERTSIRKLVFFSRPAAARYLWHILNHRIYKPIAKYVSNVSKIIKNELSVIKKQYYHVPLPLNVFNPSVWQSVTLECDGRPERYFKPLKIE